MIKSSGKDTARLLVKPTKWVALPRHVHFARGSKVKIIAILTRLLKFEIIFLSWFYDLPHLTGPPLN
jgi:hypothetical protein